MIASVYRKVLEQPILVGVQAKIGAEFIAFDADTAPRMVWVPTSDPFRPGYVRTGLEGDQLNALLKRAFLTRLATVRVHLWSKSTVQPAETVDEIEAMEELLRRTLVAVRDVAGGSFDAISFDWGGGKQEGQELAEFGRYGVLTLQFQIPVYRKDDEIPFTTATPTTLTQTGTEGDETGSPAP